MNPQLKKVQEALQPLRQQLFEHPIYQHMHTLQDLQLFMQHHVFAVWDFMSLLKALQRNLSCVTLPWTPQGDPLSRRLINEIVLEEESDRDVDGGYISHFELYYKAMEQAGANTQPIRALLTHLTAGLPLTQAIRQAGAPASAVDFVTTTWSIIERNVTHEIAAAFTLGREDVIPAMFRNLLNELIRNNPAQLSRYQYYLERHIDLDEEHHTPMAMQMLENLCGNESVKWQAVQQTATQALQARIRLWDGLLKEFSYA